MQPNALLLARFPLRDLHEAVWPSSQTSLASPKLASRRETAHAALRLHQQPPADKPQRPLQPELLGDRGEELLEGCDADRGEHPLDLLLGVRDVAHVGSGLSLRQSPRSAQCFW